MRRSLLGGLMKPAGQFKNLVVIKPVILLSYELRSQIMAFVNGTNTSECQWFHTIERTVNHKGDKAIYTLRHMLIPEQEVTGATVESPEKGMLALWNELKEKHKNEDGSYDRDTVNSIVSKMHAWCHSHVNMTASPSGTDESTFKQWIDQNDKQGDLSPVVMMIVNKREEVYIRLYDPELGIYCENPDIEIVMPSVDLTYVDEAIKNKVKSKSFYNSTGFQGRLWGAGQDNNRIITGTSSQQEITDPKVESPSKQVPSIVKYGRTMLGAETGNLEQDLIEVAISARCQEQAERVTKAVTKALTDESELYIFSLLLKNEKDKVLALVDSPKSIKIPTEDLLFSDIFSCIAEGWYEHPHIFYATVNVAARIANLSGKPQKRVREANLLISDLTGVASLYDTPLASRAGRNQEKTI